MDTNYYGFPPALVDTFDTHYTKYYDDKQKKFVRLSLPKNYTLLLSTENIAAFVQSGGITNALIMLSNYQNLFKYFTKMRVNYDVSFDKQFYNDLVSEFKQPLPCKLQTSFEFRYIDSKIEFPNNISYMFSRFMIPSKESEPLLINSDKKLAETFKQSYVDVFDNCLKAWAKLESIDQKQNMKAFDKTRETIKRILFVMFNAAETTDCLIYKLASAVLFNNLPQLVQSIDEHINKDLFDITKIDNHTVDEYEQLVRELSTNTQPTYTLLKQCLEHVVMFKTRADYQLYQFDNDIRTLIFTFTSTNMMHVFTKNSNEKAFKQLVNKISAPSPKSPIGLRPMHVAEFEAFPRDKFLKHYFTNMLSNHDFAPTLGQYFPLLKHYYYKNEFDTELFKYWTSIDYYNCSKQGVLTFSEFGIFLEWCMFIQDINYTRHLFKIIVECPIDAREFVYNNIYSIDTHYIFKTMKNGGLVVNNTVIIPSFATPNDNLKAIKQLFTNFEQGVNEPNGNILKESSKNMPFSRRCAAMDILDAI